MRVVKKSKFKAQNLIEGILIFAVISIACFGFVMKFDFSKFKNYVFLQPTDSNDSSRIEFRAMTP